MVTKSVKATPDVGISIEKRYEIIREQIRHEDGLINQRLNWLLLSQGFLIAAFTSIVTSTNALKFISASATALVLFGIPITGLLLNFLSYVGLHAAYRSLKYLRENWRDARPSTKDDQKFYDSFPQITWVGHALTTASGTPFVISSVWLFLAISVNVIGNLIWPIVVVSVTEIIWMIYSTMKS